MSWINGKSNHLASLHAFKSEAVGKIVGLSHFVSVCITPIVVNPFKARLSAAAMHVTSAFFLPLQVPMGSV